MNGHENYCRNAGSSSSSKVGRYIKLALVVGVIAFIGMVLYSISPATVGDRFQIAPSDTTPVE
jgi:hypothetical protein